MIETVHGEVPLELMFDIGGTTAIEEGSGLRDMDGARRHDQPPFDTFTFESEAPLAVQALHGGVRVSGRSLTDRGAYPDATMCPRVRSRLPARQEDTRDLGAQATWMGA